MLTIDPNCLIWPCVVINNTEAIEELGDFMIKSLEIVNETNSELILPYGLEDEIAVDHNSPCGDLFTESFPEHQSLTLLFLQIYTTLQISYFDEENNDKVTSNPNLKHTGSTHAVNYIIDSLLNNLIQNELFSMISHSRFVGDAKEVFINSDEKKSEGIITGKLDLVENLCLSHNRIFEPNVKHDQIRHHKSNKNSEVSILKSSSEHCLKLLRTAKPLTSGNSDKLYNYDEEIDEYIVFHQHEKGKWHGFNPSSVELRIRKLLNKD